MKDAEPASFARGQNLRRSDHIRYVDGQAATVPAHGGVTARTWRRQVALGGRFKGKSPPAPMKTLVFPLDADIPIHLFSTSAAHYQTIEGTGEGSLYRLLLRVHLAGLTPFGSEGTAEVVRKQRVFPDEAFSAAAADTFGDSAAKLTPSFLYAQFLRTPRARAGNAPVFTEVEVANWLHKGRFQRSMPADVAADLKALLDHIAAVVVAQVGSYSDLRRKALEVLAEIGRTLHQQSSAFPLLGISLPADIPSPLAFTGIVAPIEEDEPAAFWLHHVIAHILLERPDSTDAEIQDGVLSPNNNALSQLFNRLIQPTGLLCAGDAHTLAQSLGAPASREADFARLMEAARAVPPPALFSETSYAGYRPNFGGRIRSWISNYLNRLQTLRDQFNALAATHSLPDSTPELREILSGLGLDPASLSELFALRHSVIHEAQTCVAVLRGLDQSLRPIQAARLLEQLLKTLAGIHGSLNQVRNQLLQHEEQQANGARQAWIDALNCADASVFALPGVNWGNAHAEPELASLNADLTRLMNATQSLRRLVAPASGIDFQQYLANLKDDESTRFGARVAGAAGTTPDFDDLGRRRFLQGLAALAQRLSPVAAAVVWEWLESLIKDSPGKRPVPAKRVFNRLKFNRQGRLYVSPWSKGRHHPLMIDGPSFADQDWAEKLEQLAAHARGRLESSPSAQSLQDHMEIERFVTQVAVGAMAGPLRRGDLERVIDVETLEPHPSLASALRADHLSRQTLSRLLALIDGHLGKLRFGIRRPAFVVRHKFSRIEQTKLYHGEKLKAKIDGSPRLWTPPAKYFEGHSRIARALARTSEFNPGVAMDAAQALQAVARQPIDLAGGALLQQIPHDLYVNLGFKLPVGVQVNAIALSKDLLEHLAPEEMPASSSPSRRGRWSLDTITGAKLIGAPSFIGKVGSALVGKVMINEWTLVLDWLHESKVVMREGVPAIEATLTHCQPRIAVPLTPQDQEQRQVRLFERMVAIDLGERQIGYAVFDLRQALSTGEPLQPMADPLTGKPAVGAIQVPGVRSLINSVKVHRSTQASTSRVRDRFDTRLQDLREVVTGQVLHVIESLCARFGAFPVLESSVTNFQTGSRQLDLVYGSVVRMYTYSDVDAHNNKRIEHWMGADRWTHPYLMAREFDQSTRSRGTRVKPLNLFPGASIHPAGTSQRCVQCGRNPMEAFRKLEEQSPRRRVTVRQGGLVDVDGGVLQLMQGVDYDEATLRKARHQKHNLPLNKPLGAGVYEGREVLAALRRTLRQKPASTMAKDTTQSRYQCVYIDCGHSCHADAGAAINIGRKFFKEKIDSEASRLALASYVQSAGTLVVAATAQAEATPTSIS